MEPINFPEANVVFGSPEDLKGSCQDIKGYAGEVKGGVFDGSVQIIVAWQPTQWDIERIVAGRPIFLSVIGSLPPHRMCMSFEEAKLI